MLKNSDSWSRGYRLICLLSGGRQLDAEGLGAELGLSSKDVLDTLALLRGAGLQLSLGAGDSYRLSKPVELLDAQKIAASLLPHADTVLGPVEVLEQVGSTNSWLLEQPRAPAGRGRACLAEIQTAGRGRRGRQWLAPPTGSLCLSLAWHFPWMPPDMSCLSLACGIAVVRALEELGVEGVRIKWPNDLMWQDRKLAGLLVEMRSDGSGAAHVVIGLGLNVDLGDLANEIQTGWGPAPVDLMSVAPDHVSDRNVLAATVLNSLTDILLAFPASGFAGLEAEWQRLDGLNGRLVTVQGEDSALTGEVLGVDKTGALRVLSDGKEVQCVAGDVSVRPGDATAD